MIVPQYKGVHAKVVIVGANSAIGQALIAQLLESGAAIFGIDIQETSKTTTSEQYRYYTIDPLHLQEMERVAEKVKEQVDAITGLVNLSGTIKQFKSIKELTLEEWTETYDISFKSCFNSCKVFLPILQKSEQSAIVNMSSGLAFIGQKNYGPYASGKASVLAFSRTLATELAPQIRVNTVAPGAVDTNFIYKEDGTTRFDKENYIKMVPLGALAKSQEISAVILFLLSEGASHMTGQCLHINGGAGMH